MKKDDFIKEFSEFEDLFKIVSEPAHSKQMLIELEEKYAASEVNSHVIYWYYKIQGFDEISEYIPEIDTWVYYYERFLRYGGNLRELKDYDDSSVGQVQCEEKESGSENHSYFFCFL